MYADLTDLIEEEGIDLVANWGSDAFKYEDRIYTLPCGGLSYYVAINMDAWNAAGLGELPTEWTWDEYLAACEAMTRVQRRWHREGIRRFRLPQRELLHLCPWFHCGQERILQGRTARRPSIRRRSSTRWSARCRPSWWTRSGSRRRPIAAITCSPSRFSSWSVLPIPALRRTWFGFLPDTENYGVDFIVGFAPFPVEEKGQVNYMSGVSPFSHAGICMDPSDEDFDAAWGVPEMVFYLRREVPGRCRSSAKLDGYGGRLCA